MKTKIDLQLGDCIELMKNIPNESVNLVLSDPPYLINYKTNYRKNKTHDFCFTIQNDDNELLIKNYFLECYRILKENSAAYIFCSAKQIEKFKLFINCTKFILKNQIIWVKNNWTAGDLKAQFGQQYEIIILINKLRK